jgi:hypothetical protein
VRTCAEAFEQLPLDSRAGVLGQLCPQGRHALAQQNRGELPHWSLPVFAHLLQQGAHDLWRLLRRSQRLLRGLAHLHVIHTEMVRISH